MLRSVGKRLYRLSIQITRFLMHGLEHVAINRLIYLAANK